MLNTLTLKQAINKLNAKEISLDELYADVDKAVKEKNKKLNIYLTLNEQALQQAKLQQTEALNGMPIAIKDNFLTKDLRTTASSKVLDNYLPQYESAVTNKLQ